MRASRKNHCFSILCFLFVLLFPITTSENTLTATQSLTNNQTLVSSSGVFELGFFNPGNSNWYLGIWYKQIPEKTVVWVANRDSPLSNSSATLKIGNDGNLILLDYGENIAWSSNETEAKNLFVQLLDSGNLVLKEEKEKNPEIFLWQSFDYPTDTLLPDMKLGWDLKKGLDRYITSWKSQDDPSTGDYSFKLDYHGFPEIFLLKNQMTVYRSGPWNGLGFSGVPEMMPMTGFEFSFITNEDEVYYSFSINKISLLSRLLVNSSGQLQRFTWIQTSKSWNLFWYAPKDQCDNYKECGPYGICDTNVSPVCQCVKGFMPKNLQAWNLRDGSDGCIRKTELQCHTDKFLLLKKMKLPETRYAFVDRSLSIEECKKRCLENCSCTAYANANITNGGSGCVTWNVQLVDIRDYAEGGQNFYVRLAASELGTFSFFLTLFFNVYF